jgi:hypothetical protein
LCLTLRDEHGQLARLATNVDGLLLSLLVEAQAPQAGRYRVAGPCPLRRMRTATVAASTEPGVRFAAAVSLVAAASRLQDHIYDGDGPFARTPAALLARQGASRFAAAGTRSAAAVGFDADVLTSAAITGRQRERAARPGSPVLAVTEPTEAASAAAFAHTAVLAGCPHNQEPLATAGRMFGRLVHLVDAVADLPADRARGAWNPLVATGTDLPQAAQICRDALAALRDAVARLHLHDGRLVELLLVHEVGRVVRRTFAAVGVEGAAWLAAAGPAPPGGGDAERRRRRREEDRRRREENPQPPAAGPDDCDDCCDCADCCCDDDDDDDDCDC